MGNTNIVECLLTGAQFEALAKKLDDNIPGRITVKAMASEMVSERKNTTQRITINEIESLIFAIRELALCNTFRFFQGKNTNKDISFNDFFNIEDDTHPLSRIREFLCKIKAADQITAQLSNEVFYCLTKDIDCLHVDVCKFEDNLSDQLEGIAICCYKLLYAYFYDEIS